MEKFLMGFAGVFAGAALAWFIFRTIEAASVDETVEPSKSICAGATCVRIVRDEKRKVTCYVVGTSGGISCLPDIDSLTKE